MSNKENLSRRSFGRTAVTSASALAASAGSSVFPAQTSGSASPQDNFYSFPDGFLWGCATAAFQIEGGATADGRGPSIWDKFSHTPGKVFENQTGDVAVDDYHRYKEDIQLLKAVGAKTYRFSIAWPRIFPQGTGQPNEKGLAFYQRVLDELASQEITPYCTLFHWDLPQALQDKWGGWESRDTAQAFGDYAGYIAERLSDRIHYFFTMNEFSSFIDLGYKEGRFAPGLKLPAARLNQARHNAVLGHGLAVQAIRAKGRPGTKVGLVENLISGVPVVETEKHIEASRKATRVLNAQYLTVIMEGKYVEEYLQDQGKAAPKFSEEDLKTISSPLDCLGVNLYNPTYVRADEGPRGFATVPNPTSFPHMLSSWLYVGPEALYWAPRHVAEIWNVKEIYVTENGCSSADVVAADGHVYDTDRVMYLRNYLQNLQRAVKEGFPVRGYFVWSLMDNFEWADGYNLRFGIYYLDYKTQKRIPKLSAEFYKETVARNAIL